MDWEEEASLTGLNESKAAGVRSLSESVRLRCESGAAERRSAMKASRAAEREAMAIARERGFEERHEVLEALALTLDANAERLATEEVRVAAAREATEAEARRVAERARRIEDAEAEHAAAARWLRREASRGEAEESRRRGELEALAASTRKSADEVRAREGELRLLDEALERRQSNLGDAAVAAGAREAACDAREHELEARARALEAEARRARAATDALEAREADVDARAHAVASADATARDRLEALSRRADAMAEAREELDRRAAMADALIARADERVAAAAAKEAEIEAKETAAGRVEAAAETKMREAEAKLVAAAEAAKAGQDEATARDARSREDLDARRRTVDDAAAEAERATREANCRAAESEEIMDRARRESADADARRRALDARETALEAREAACEKVAEQASARVVALEEREAASGTARAALEALHALTMAKDANIERERGDSAATLAALEARERALAKRTDEARARGAELDAIAGCHRDALLAAQPWLVPRVETAPYVPAWQSRDWVRAVARRASAEQARSHEDVRAARATLRKLDRPAVWALLPRDARAALRTGVALGDRIRAACADLHAAVVRRFLRACAAVDDEPDDFARDAMAALRGVASQELVRRKALVAAIAAAHFRDDDDDDATARLRRLESRRAPATFFRLQSNLFDALRLRFPAAKARFSAAAGHWAAPEFRRYLFDRAADLNGLHADRIELARRERGASAGVFFADSRLELRFDDDGDDGRHAPRAACVFDRPDDLVDFFDRLDNDPRAACVAVSNGFSLQTDQVPSHELAVALDLDHQGVLCDLRLRLRPLERPQRHLGSFRFLAEVESHEEILLPLWRDINHHDAWLKDLAAANHNRLRRQDPPPYDHHHDDKPGADWPAPPNYWRKTAPI